MKSVSYEVWDQASAIYSGRYMAWIQTHNQIWNKVRDPVLDQIRIPGTDILRQVRSPRVSHEIRQ